MEVKILVKDSWSNGGSATLKVFNTTNTIINNWKFKLRFININDPTFWNMNVLSENGIYIVQGQSWNPHLGANATVESNFNYTGNTSIIYYEIVEANDNIISVNTDSGIDTSMINNTIATTATATTATTDNVKFNKKIFAYFTEWSIYARNYNINDISANKISHLLYAFMLPNPSQADFNLLMANYPFPPVPYNSAIPEGTLVHHDGGAAYKNIPALQSLKAKNPHLKVLISIGGWSLSWILSKVCADTILRKRFVESSVSFIVKNGFDGIDIDWEYVGVQGPGYNYLDAVNDPLNFVLLLQDMRKEMDLKSPNKKLEITAATGANPTVLQNYKSAFAHLDYVLLMTYDYAGAWQREGGHQSGLYKNPADNNQPFGFNVDFAVKKVIELGCSKSKICVGSPLYGRGWSKLEGGIFGTVPAGYSIAANSYSGVAGQPGVSSWRHLRDKIKDGTLIEYIDEIAKGAHAINPNTKETWSYDNIVTASDKANYVVDNDLAGVLMWELSDDVRDGTDSLLDAIYTVFELTTNTTNTTSTSETTTASTQPPTAPIQPPTTSQPTQLPTVPITTNETTNNTTTITEHQCSIIITNTGLKDIVIKAGETITAKELRVEIKL
jgi:chitinase